MRKKLDIIIIFIFIIIGVIQIVLLILTGINNKNNNKITTKEKIVEDTTQIEFLTSEIERLEEEIVILRTEECQYDLSLIEPLKDKDLKEYYIKYMDICYKYEDLFGLPVSIYDVYSEEEIYIIQRCIETEVYQTPYFESRVNVANVILNRVESEQFSDNPITVVTSPSQFAYWRKDIEEDTIIALECAFIFEDTTQGALYFHSNPKTNYFNGYEYIFTDKSGHHFY